MFKKIGIPVFAVLAFMVLFAGECWRAIRRNGWPPSLFPTAVRLFVPVSILRSLRLWLRIPTLLSLPVL